jgi:Fe-S cluster assembly protein SufD
VVKGIAKDNGVGTFDGLVYVAPDAQRTEAYQQSRNMLLSRTARIHTNPQLEIYADDVRCSHGATVGNIDDDAIYYMRQRGLSEEQARKLQVGGFLRDVLGHIDDEAIREEFELKVEN